MLFIPGPHWKPTFVEWATLVKYHEINEYTNQGAHTYHARCLHVALRLGFLIFFFIAEKANIILSRINDSVGIAHV